MPSAIAYLTSNSGVTGSVNFTQQGPTDSVSISVNANGVATGFHALHINTYGDISQGRNTTGAVFNPTNGMNPIGDLQTIRGTNGFVQEDKTSASISLFDGPNCIIGRAVVIYGNNNPNNPAIAWGVVGHLP